jgi:hypothetical protein
MFLRQCLQKFLDFLGVNTISVNNQFPSFFIFYSNGFWRMAFSPGIRFIIIMTLIENVVRQSYHVFRHGRHLTHLRINHVLSKNCIDEFCNDSWALLKARYNEERITAKNVYQGKTFLGSPIPFIV